MACPEYQSNVKWPSTNLYQVSLYEVIGARKCLPDWTATSPSTDIAPYSLREHNVGIVGLHHRPPRFVWITYSPLILSRLNSRSLVAEHLYTPKDLYFTSINAADISGLSISEMENRTHHVSYISTSSLKHIQSHPASCGAVDQYFTSDTDYGFGTRDDNGGLWVEQTLKWWLGGCHKMDEISGSYPPFELWRLC